MSIMPNLVQLDYSSRLLGYQIPMGSDCGPYLANLFLFAYEYRYVMNMIDNGNTYFKRFLYIFRYIDDLLSRFANIE